MANVRPTIKTDYTMRVVAFDNVKEARAEAADYRKDGQDVKIKHYKGVYNVLVK